MKSVEATSPNQLDHPIDDLRKLIKFHSSLAKANRLSSPITDCWRTQVAAHFLW